MKVMYITMQCQGNRVEVVSRNTVKSCKCQLCCGGGGVTAANGKGETSSAKDGRDETSVDNGCVNGRPLADEV